MRGRLSLKLFKIRELWRHITCMGHSLDRGTNLGRHSDTEGARERVLLIKYGFHWRYVYPEALIPFTTSLPNP